MSHNHLPGNDERELPEFNRMQTVKRRFFAMRNGALAEQMRRGGLSYRINFGLNIPQIKDIAHEVHQWDMSLEERMELADALWRNDTTRESRLMAPMIVPSECVTPELAAQWMRDAQTPEVADMLCHSLLRKLPYAGTMAYGMLENNADSDMNRYTALRLLMNLLMLGRTDAVTLRGAAEDELKRGCGMTHGISRQILDEIAFMLEDDVD